MDLFPPDPSLNLLPADGIVNYHGTIMSAAEADRYRDALLREVPWQPDEVLIYGKHITTARKVAWYGDAHFAYTYSGITRKALPWNRELLELKALIEQRSGERFNSCLLNLYHDGNEGMSWHSDDEKTLGRHSAIASLSLGAERRFCFKHKHKPLNAEILLEHGALLLMKGSTQTNWLHSIPKSKKISDLRINLTFRTIVGQGGD